MDIVLVLAVVVFVVVVPVLVAILVYDFFSRITGEKMGVLAGILTVAFVLFVCVAVLVALPALTPDTRG